MRTPRSPPTRTCSRRIPRTSRAYKNLGEVLLAAGEIDALARQLPTLREALPEGAAARGVRARGLPARRPISPASSATSTACGATNTRRATSEELVDCLEELLYLLLFFDVEPALMLRLAQAYDAAAPQVYGAPLPSPAERAPGPLRIGYLSADLRNHVMGKMMWQAIAHHDRARFEFFFYSKSHERDEWTERFVARGQRFAVIAGLDERAAAQRIADDDLDILVDLSTHTRGARPGILALKPARVQITHVASAGTVGLSTIDFKLTDRFADVPESQEFQIEPLLAMDGCVYPYRHVAPAAPHPFHRAGAGHPRRCRSSSARS